MATFEEELSQLRSGSEGGIPDISGELGALRTQGTAPTPTTVRQNDGAFKSFFKEEIGAVSTIISPFFSREAERIVARNAEGNAALIELFRNMPNSDPRKDRLRGQLEAMAQGEGSVKFEDIVGSAQKTTSQALGEAVTLSGLLIPGGLLTKGFKGASFLKKFLVVGAEGSAFGGAIGLAQEGEIQEKLPDVALGLGIGFVGGGVLGGVLPPALKLLPKGMKELWSKVHPKRGKGRDTFVIPTVSYEKVVPKVTTKSALELQRGTKPIIHAVDNLEQKINQKSSELDNLIVSTDFIAPKAGANRAAEEVTETTLKKRGQTIIKLEKELKGLEKKKNRLLAQSSFKSLKSGDEIFNKDIGRVRVDSFLTDEFGRVNILGRDVNGRAVTVTADDILNMKRIVKSDAVVTRKFDNIPDIPAEFVERGRPQRIMDGVRSLLKTSRIFLDENMGESGKALGRLLSTTLDETERKAGFHINQMNRLVTDLGLDQKGKALTLAEQKEIVYILDVGIKEGAKKVDDVSIRPSSDRVRTFTRGFFKITKSLVDEADGMGLQVRDRTTGKKHSIGEALVHFPHIPRDPEKFRKNAPKIAALLMKRRNLTRQQANAVLNNFIKDMTTNRYAGIEQSRTFPIEGFDELEKFGYETNPLVALQDFISGSSRRITEAKNFGKEGELVAQLIDDIGKGGYDNGLASNIWNKYNGNRSIAKTEKEFTTAILAVQTVAKLPLSAIVNSTQIINTMSEFGVKSFGRGLRRYIMQNASVKESGLLAGITDQAIERANRLAGGDTRLSQDFLRNVGFTGVERFNRFFTVATVQEWTEKEALPELIKNANNPKLRRHLERLGIVDVDKVIKRGKFTQEESNIIGQAAVKSTQFRGSVLDVPLFWTSPWGKVVTQFKSFAWQQGSFIKREIFDEAANGNMAPFITYMLASQIAGESINDIKSVIKGDFDFRGDLSTFERIVDNTFSVGGFGLAGDLFERMFLRARGNYFVSVADMIAGPTGGDVVEVTDGLAELAGGNYKSITNFAGREAALLALVPQLRNIPGSGAIMRVLGDMLANVITAK